jgi:hypothetical protein
MGTLTIWQGDSAKSELLQEMFELNQAEFSARARMINVGKFDVNCRTTAKGAVKEGSNAKSSSL